MIGVSEKVWIETWKGNFDMKAKRVLKVTGKFILVILILIIVVLIITSVLFRLRVNKAKNYLKDNGYYNLVSAGD